MRDMKFHILKEFLDDATGESKVTHMNWGDKAIEFDTRENAQRFLDAIDRNLYEREGCFSGGYVDELIVFSDNGYLNCEYKTVKMDKKTGREMLVNVEDV